MPDPRSAFTPAELAARNLHRRAVEAVLWGMPAVNFELMGQAMTQSAQWNQVTYWSRLPSWKNQTLTPNPDVIYVFPFYDTRNGLVVLDIPPAGDDGSITGSIDGGWQAALEDVGPAGADKGEGGKYLILPPDHEGAVPEGYIPLLSETWRGCAILRSNLKSGAAADVARAVAYGKRVGLYPLDQAASPPDTVFVDVVDKVFDPTIPYDIRFFEALDRFVQYEPWIVRDKAMIDVLRTIGIEKGKPFQPDAATADILNAAAAEAHALLEIGYEQVFDPPYFPGTHWALPASPEVVTAMQTDFADPEHYPVDGRAVSYSMAYFSAKHLGAGQFYLMSIVDSAGRKLSGAATYKLTVPARAPVRLYWSATLYDRATHALIHDREWSSRASTTPGLQANADGSTDVYFGPKAPAGKESNWVPTDAGGAFEVLFRFYGPEKPLFDKTWTLPDIEKID